MSMPTSNALNLSHLSRCAPLNFSQKKAERIYLG
jgi:hypothetical protein